MTRGALTGGGCVSWEEPRLSSTAQGRKRRETARPPEVGWERTLIRNLRLEPESVNTGQVTEHLCASVSSLVNRVLKVPCLPGLWWEQNGFTHLKVCRILPHPCQGPPRVWHSRGTSSPLNTPFPQSTPKPSVIAALHAAAPAQSCSSPCYCGIRRMGKAPSRNTG